MFPDDGDVFGAFHVESDGCSLRHRLASSIILMTRSGRAALRKSTVPRRLHCFIAKSETRHEAALRWGQVQDVPVLVLQTQTNRPLVSRSATLERQHHLLAPNLRPADPKTPWGRPIPQPVRHPCGRLLSVNAINHASCRSAFRRQSSRLAATKN